MSESRAIQTVRPTNRQEFMDKLVMPYDTRYGNPNQVFSEPAKLGQPEKNRAYEVSLKKDTDKDFYIGIKDLEEAVMHYFQNVLKLSVVQNNTRVDVPVIYGTPENWKTVQKDGYYRDKNGKLMAPLLMFKRNSITQNRDLGNKIDGNLAHNLQLFEKGFDKRNIYGNFSVLNNRVPEKSYVVAVTPDYVTVEYTCIVWTYFVEQMDKLIEALNFASRSYWGDPNRFQFYSSIESFQDNITYDVGDDRAVKNTFTLTLNGYLIPDSINKAIASVNRAYGVSKVFFTMETATSSEDFEVLNQQKQTNAKGAITVASSINNVFAAPAGNIDPQVYAYLNTSIQENGTYIDPVTVTFPRAWLLAPTGLPVTSINDFSFFVNGAFIDQTSVVSWTTDGVSISTLVIDPVALQFSFGPTDLITAIGKFK
jgi:hypothetical protein